MDASNRIAKGSKEVEASNRDSRTDKQARETSKVDKAGKEAKAIARPDRGAQGPRRLRGGNPGENDQQRSGESGLRNTQPGGPDGGGGRLNGDGTRSRVGPGGPIRGGGYREWTDRMRDVEELLDNPDMRAEAARIRDRVRGEREDYKRKSKEPDWNKLKDLVAEPMNELRKRIAEEVRRRESPDALVPIDRDPVPPQFAEGVRRYYERLGSGQ